MGLFNFIETFFFISLGITFILILLLVYLFKQKLSNLEQKNDSMVCIINNIVKELSTIKQISNMLMCNRTTPVYGKNNFIEKEEDKEEDEDEVEDEEHEDEEHEDEDEDSDYASDDEDDDTIIKILDYTMSVPSLEINEITEVIEITEEIETKNLNDNEPLGKAQI